MSEAESKYTCDNVKSEFLEEDLLNFHDDDTCSKEELDKFIKHKYTCDNVKSEFLEDDLLNFHDDDTCSKEELDKFFKHKYKKHDEIPVANDGNYVLRLAKDDHFTCIAAGLSNGSVRLFEINSEKGLYIEPPEVGKKLSICDMRFLDETANLLLVGTTNGLVRLLDLRTKKEVKRFQNRDGELHKDILSFDKNSNGRLLAMGSVQRGGVVNILFFDLRKSKKLYNYYDSHHDDVTTLCFHPENPDILCSGSTDGLINIYNVAYDKSDAILTTINTENTVYKVNWHKNKLGSDVVSCITPTNDFKNYEFDGDIIHDFDRLKISATIKRKNQINCDLISCFSTSDNEILLITGSHFNKGSVLRSCKLENGQLLPYANFEKNSQIVRDSIFDCNSNILITAGESGCVTLWTPLREDAVPTSGSYKNEFKDSKIKSLKSNRMAPY